MLSFVMSAVLLIVASEQQPVMDYAAAYQAAQKEGKPLMVVVGTDWCQACVDLKHQTIPSMKSTGALSGVAIAMVNRDSQPALAGKLTRGRTIPQIIVFSQKSPGSWTRLQLTGKQSESSIRSLVDAAQKKNFTGQTVSHSTASASGS